MKPIILALQESIKDSLIKFKLKYFPFPTIVENDNIHLIKTMGWLNRSFIYGKGGCSSHYSLISGNWLEPYPETTGYIIPTFFDYYYFSSNRLYYNNAVKMTNWLCDVQLEDGGCIGGRYNKKQKSKSIIFNTGQNLLGFIRAYKETWNKKYLNSAKKAGDFLIRNVDERDIWNKNLHNNLKHTYNSRTSWALLILYNLTKKNDYKKIALINLDWTIKQQKDNGWFKNANFKDYEFPNTHSLAYTIRGLLESYILTKNTKYLHSSKLTADKFLSLFETKKFLSTFWDDNWKSHGKFIKASKGNFMCLTGNIQLSIVWMKLYQITKDLRYINSAFKMVDFIKIF